MPALVLERVSYRYPLGEPAAREVSLSVDEGAMVGLLGPNGAGKSTLVKLVNGLLRPEAGRILLRDRDLREWRRRELARSMAVVHQSQPLFFPFTVGETVAMGRWPWSGATGRVHAGDRQAIEQALVRTGITGLRERRLEELSGGERQRVFLARALAQEADMLVMDEPVAHLDVRHQLGILGLLADLNRREGHTVILAMHDLNLAAQFCRELVVMIGGRVAARGRPDEIVEPGLIREVFGVETVVDRNPLTGSPRVSMGWNG